MEVVNPDGAAVGEATVAASHEAPGRLHRAFSVLLMDDRGRCLLQRRAPHKTRFALRWANTCCGHPGPGEDVAAAAAQRLAEEMGLPAGQLREAGRFLYRATDPTTGRVECEYDHVLIGRIDPATQPQPDPTEVAEWRWVDPDELSRDLRQDPQQYAPWLPHVVRVATNLSRS